MVESVEWQAPVFYTISNLLMRKNELWRLLYIESLDGKRHFNTDAFIPPLIKPRQSMPILPREGRESLPDRKFPAIYISAGANCI